MTDPLTRCLRGGVGPDGVALTVAESFRARLVGPGFSGLGVARLAARSGQHWHGLRDLLHVLLRADDAVPLITPVTKESSSSSSSVAARIALNASCRRRFAASIFRRSFGDAAPYAIPSFRAARTMSMNRELLFSLGTWSRSRSAGLDDHARR